MNIHAKEDLIYQEIERIAKANNDADELTRDGLLFRGRIEYSEGCWHRSSGDEEARWNNAKGRLLILTKDVNDEEAWDIREETGRMNGSDVLQYTKCISFYKRLRMFSYGILNSTPDGFPPFSEARNMNISGPFYEEAPIARMNLKKQVGGSRISNAVLRKYMETYKNPIMEQMKLYDANIVFCAGCSKDGYSIILNFVKDNYLHDLEVVDGTGEWIYHSPKRGKIVINSFHPSMFSISDEQFYNDLVSNYHIAIKKLNLI